MQYPEIRAYIKASLGFNPTLIKELAGYENINYLIQYKEQKYILKSYRWNQGLAAILEAENDMLLHLQSQSKLETPQPVPFIDGSYLQETTINNQHLLLRSLTFLEGTFIGDATTTKELCHSLGLAMANLNKNLSTYDNYVLRAREDVWDLQYFHLNQPYIDDIPDPHNRNIVRYFFLQHQERVAPLLPKLRKQIIHGDANEWNVLTDKNHVCGLIDFGDSCYSHLINELAIAMTYASYDKEQPLEWAIPVLKAYHSLIPLQIEEIEVLYYLIAARLCTSVCNSAYARKTAPENDYATVSEKHAWHMLHKWLRINPLRAEILFKEASGHPVAAASSADQALQKRHKHVSSILSVSYDEPIQMHAAAFQYMYDAHGNTFLDAYNNIPHVGHSHPVVVKAGQRQMATLNTNTRYLYDLLPRYAEKLLSYFPEKLTKVFFVNSGSAASDLAMRMAQAHTGHHHIMVTEHGYHGNTQIGIDISDYKFNNKRGQGRRPHIIKTQIPDTYNGPYREKDAGHKYAQDAIVQLKSASQPIAAFVSEPIVGCGGQVPLASGYLKELYPAVREQGGICISDEVQTGFGRLGDHFWGYESQQVVPDMIILGKPIANGHPMGAVVTTEEIAHSFEKGVEFFSSFGGNPVSCTIALAVLDVIEEEHLQAQAKAVGDYYKSLFLDLKETYKYLGDVRGSGLFIGVEIIHPDSKKTNRPLAHHIKNELRHRHILVSTDGPDDSVLKSKPPLCFTKENAQEVVVNIKDILDSYMKSYT